MRCSPCGARYETPSARCPECGARQEDFQVEPAPSLEPKAIAVSAEPEVVKPARKSKVVESAPKVEVLPIVPAEDPVADKKLTEPKVSEPIPPLKASPITAAEIPDPKLAKKPKFRKPTPSLIEFPGVAAMPQWRRELGERVRERRAREGVPASASAGPFCPEIGVSATNTLELLPQTEAPEINPIVVAALRRLERARTPSPRGGSAAAAFAMETQPQFDSLPPTPEMKIEPELPKPERVHNLAVVPDPDPEPPAEPAEETPEEVRKPIRPVRMIGDQNDPALNYLDSIPTSVTVDNRGHVAAPISLRIPSAVTDIVIVAVLSLPFLTLAEFTSASLDDLRVIGFLAGIIAVVTFLYLTINVAFTGRTVGMRLFSLRVVDARNGLIPTGSQAAGRALIYILSLASAGVVLLFTLIDREKYAAHDRLTRTAVVRA